MGCQVLVIGYGSIGHRHVAVLSEMPQVASIEIVTRQDTQGFKTYRALEQVRDLERFDYFVIASETHKHFDQLQYLEAAVTDKVILVEKPLFDRSRSLEVTRNQVKIAYNLRFHPILQRLRDWLRSEKILTASLTAGQYLPSWRKGRDYRLSYSSQKERGGGVTLDLSHEIDYAQWLFGRIVSLESVCGRISDLEISADDFMMLLGKTERNCAVHISLDYLSKIPLRQIIVQTETATIIADLIESRLVKKTMSKAEEQFEARDLDRNLSYRRMHEATLAEDFSMVCDMEEGLNTMTVIGKIFKSSRQKGWYVK